MFWTHTTKESRKFQNEPLNLWVLITIFWMPINLTWKLPEIHLVTFPNFRFMQTWAVGFHLDMWRKLLRYLYPPPFSPHPNSPHCCYVGLLQVDCLNLRAFYAASYLCLFKTFGRIYKKNILQIYFYCLYSCTLCPTAGYQPAYPTISYLRCC